MKTYSILFYPAFAVFLAVTVALEAWAAPQAQSAAVPAPGQNGVREGKKPRVQLGAYYFDGWSGRNKADGDPAQPWAKGAPTHLSKPLVEDFADRQPIWGWRADTPAIMRKQIDLAADHGLAFWAFCWYFQPQPKAVAEDSKHNGLRLFLEAPNNGRLRFCLLVANHDRFQLKTMENWRKAADYWLPYLRNPRHLTLGGKPLVILFNTQDALPEGMAAVEQAAKASGLPGVAFAGCGINLPKQFAATTRYNVNGGWMKGWQECPFSTLVDLHRQSWKGTPGQPHVPCAVVGFDRRPWETAQRGSHYYTGRTPELFAQHIRDLIAWMDAHPNQVTQERIALLYAWNETGEGGYLVPTRGDPDGAYLKVLKSALAR
jgi:hypothetical protein